MSVSDSLQQLEKYCLKLLSRREYSQYELKQRFLQKQYAADDIQSVLDSFVRQGWQSDDRFAESYCRHRINNGIGPNKIAYELQVRGVHEFDVNKVVDEMAENGWDDLVYQLYQKKFAERQPKTMMEWQKIVRFLQQRGFGFDVINGLSKRLNLKF